MISPSTWTRKLIIEQLKAQLLGSYSKNLFVLPHMAVEDVSSSIWWICHLTQGMLPQVISTQHPNTNVLFKQLLTTPSAHHLRGLCSLGMTVTSLVGLMLSSQRGILFPIVSLTLMAFLLI